MRIPDKTVKELLQRSGKLAADKFVALEEQANNEKLSLQEVVNRNNVLSDSELTKLYAEDIGIPFTELNAKELDREILKQIPEKIARLYNMVVFAGSIDTPADPRQIAMEDADDLQAIDVLHKLFGQNIKIFIATKINILAALDQYRGNISSEISKIVTDGDEGDDDEGVVSEADIAEDSPIAQTVNLIIEYAVKSGASDIHIEPRD